MEVKKVWIECQKCGRLFWIFPDELEKFYPKRAINYQLCGSCESKQ
jgi:Zn finger protein HypA/HybF involved in hydrogenase expression